MQLFYSKFQFVKTEYDDEDDYNEFFTFCRQRLERQTRAMDQAQYAEFCESRQLSFGEIQIK